MNEAIDCGPLIRRREWLLGLAAAGAAPALLLGCGGSDDDSAVAADPEVAAFWQSYFSAKSTRHADKLSTLFGADVVYEDNTLRRRMAGNNAFIRSQWQGLFSVVPREPRSLLDSARGTMSGAAVELTNEAGWFASVPIHGLSIADLQDSRIVRVTDYWDSAQLSDAEWAGLQAGFAMNPAWQAADTGDHPGAGHATTGMQRWVERFFAACSAGNTAAALDFFDANASYSNKPLGIAAQGSAAIARVLNAVLTMIPDGAGAQLTHAVGNELGGGFEWLTSTSAPGAVLRGATSVELAGGKITRLGVYFDSRLLTAAQKQKIADALR